jgi:hypothetical protein
MKTTLIYIAAVLFSVPIFAQDPKTKEPKAKDPKTAAATPVTDQELMKYAELMDTVNEMSAAVRDVLADMVVQNDSIDGARFNELSKIIDDDAKLAEAKATPAEIEFIKKVAAKKEEETARINATYQSLAKEYVTVPVFNKVKKALGADPVLKTRYDSLMVELGKDDPETQPK